MQETSVDETEPQIESVPTETQKSTVWHTVSISISCFFITVATVLGTGILALPVKVAKTGFFPFLTTVVTCLVAQVFIIIYMIELLQRTQALMNTKKNVEQQEDDLELTNPSHHKAKGSLLSEGPDLHTMGKFFLNRVGMVFFDFCVVLHFISILISYSLAGPTAWAQLFGLKYVLL
jgi:amino acid permease